MLHAKQSLPLGCIAPGSTAVVQWTEEEEEERRELGVRICLTHPKVGSSGK